MLQPYVGFYVNRLIQGGVHWKCVPRCQRNYQCSPDRQDRHEPLLSGLEAIIFPMDWYVSIACNAYSLGFCIQLW